MGDVTLATPLANVEAPFVWLVVTSAAVLSSWIPILWRSNQRSIQKETKLFTGWFYLWLSISFVLFTGAGYWIVRGGHMFRHRICLSVAYYALLACISTWSWPQCFTCRTWPSTVLLLLAVVSHAFLVGFSFHAQPWYGGVVQLFGGLSTVAITILWLIPVHSPGYSQCRHSQKDIPLAYAHVATSEL